MRRASLDDQARADATKAANATHSGKTDADRAADTRAANALHAGKSDRDRAADTRAANAGPDTVKSHSATSPAVSSTPSSGNPATKGGPSWTKISTVVAGDDFYGCTRVFKAPSAGQNFNVTTPVSDWSDGKTSPSSGLPKGEAGDILYNNGSTWVKLTAPTGFAADPVMRHNGTNPYWEEPTGC